MRRRDDAPPLDREVAVEPLLSRRMLLLVWLPVALIGLGHYGAPISEAWLHDILRRLYHLPIVIAAFYCGHRGGVVSASVVSASYLPHAFFHAGHLDPAHALEKALEIVLYYAIALVTGYLADLERRRARELGDALRAQRELTRELARADRLRSLGELVAGVAHEIKNPLHALAGTAEIIAPCIDPASEERRMWELHTDEIARLRKVSERFLSFARPAELHIEDLDLRDVARRFADLVAADARKKGVGLETVLPNVPVPVRGDRDQLAQIVLNIAVNAFEAMGDTGEDGGDGGQLRITVEGTVGDERPLAHIRIENDGPPIPPEEQERLFDPFHSGGEGTGLGLSISSRLADLHGGWLTAANAGLGVTFTLTLPRST